MRMTTRPNSSQYWRYIDEQFYVMQCIKRGIGLLSRKPDYLLDHYLANVTEYELSPNPFFSEPFYLHLYPNVAASVQSGHFKSGFDHYDRVGASAGNSPSWFFHPVWYSQRNSDLSRESLAANELDGVYSHFFASGLSEKRPGNWLMMALWQARQPGGYPTSMDQFRTVLTEPEQLTRWLAPVFDAEWFAARYDTAGRPMLDIEQYMLFAGRDRLSPNPFFDEAFYQRTYPDVASAVATGSLRTGFEHFVLYGAAEGRQPLATFDPAYYRAMNPGVADECRRHGLTPYFHYLRFGRGRMLRIEPSNGARPIPEAAGKGVFERRAAVIASLPLRLSEQSAPDVSVIIITRNKFEETLLAISSIVRGTAASLEVIVYDNASTDDIPDLETMIPAVRYMRSEVNKGFTIPVNEAVERARGRYLVLANNDVELAPGAIDVALRHLANDPGIGVVGGRIIRSHGLLQEAGSLVWRDGSCLGYGRDFAPNDGRVLFQRDVDFCSGCLLAIRREDWEILGGFDPAFAPAYYEETDFCLRMWNAGKRVVYDPAVVAWHFEFGSSTVPEQAIALMRRNQRIFARKHAAALASRPVAHPAHVERARLFHARRPRVLFVEDTVPVASRGMGFVRSSRIVEVLAGVAGLVTVVGLHPVPEGARPRRREADGSPLELLYELDHTKMVEFLRSRIGVYDHLWISRTHNLPHLNKWKAEVPEFFDGLTITLDTEAIASARVAHQARLLDETVDEAALMAVELAGHEIASQICVVNDIDRGLVEQELRRSGSRARVVTLGHALPRRAPVPSFEETSKIAIVGSFGNIHSPNVDAVHWFDSEVRPLLDQRFASVPFVLAGHRAAELRDVLKLEHEYEFASDIPDMRTLYRDLRISLAPTRFAGGIPFKVHEAASYGVPVVMSDLLGRQLGWTDEADIAVARTSEPAEFVELLARTYFDEAIWTVCQHRQLELITRDCSEVAFHNEIRRCLGLQVGDGASVSGGGRKRPGGGAGVAGRAQK